MDIPHIHICAYIFAWNLESVCWSGPGAAHANGIDEIKGITDRKWFAGP